MGVANLNENDTKQTLVEKLTKLIGQHYEETGERVMAVHPSWEPSFCDHHLMSVNVSLEKTNLY